VRRRAVVTGIGLVTPIGSGVADFWGAALAGAAACAPIPEPWRAYYQPLSTHWAPLPTRDFAPYGVSRIEAGQLDRAEQIALACAWQALADAGIATRLRDEKKNTFALADLDPSNVGVFMGTGIGGATTLTATVAHHVGAPLQAALAGLRDQAAPAGADGDLAARIEALRAGLRFPPRFNPFAVTMCMPNGASAIIGIKFGLQGANATYAGACASGTMAIGAALRAVRSGEVPLALAGGVEYLADDYGGIFRGFDVVRTLALPGEDPLRANRPFDAARTGFLFAEGGGAVLVLEELEHARRRGARIVAELAGYGESFDAHSVMTMEPSGALRERMVQAALADAGVGPGQIDYVNAHGTGTPQNDETESALLRRLFGERVLVNSTKSLIGHTLGASGAIAAAVTALSLRDQTTHACANLETPINGLRYVREPGPFAIGCALTESFAFGGHNAALVLKRFNP
jgi:3-oxoacyl-[acyl-carrier-protein] synthase II